MSLDLQRDARRLWIGLVTAGGIGLLTLLLVGAAALGPEYQDTQAGFARLGLGESPGEIQQQVACTGEVDRCTSCHLGIGQVAPSGAEVPQPYRAHPAAWRGHLQRAVGCSVCHGGTPRALTAAEAHAGLGQPVVDPLLKLPHQQAACARCHVPGAHPGQERLVRGIDLYLGLGCPICHPLTGGGRGGWDFGTDLRTLGRKSLPYLKASLLEPTANFPQSTMPSFRDSLGEDPSALDDLLIFLDSLALERGGEDCSERPRSQALSQAPCINCHAGPGGRALGRLRHRCVYLIERRQELSCPACHAQAVPENGPQFGGVCPVVARHLDHCAACHDEPRGGPSPSGPPEGGRP